MAVRDQLEALTIETNQLQRQHATSVDHFDRDLDNAVKNERMKTAASIAELEKQLKETLPQIQVQELHTSLHVMLCSPSLSFLLSASPSLYPSLSLFLSLVSFYLSSLSSL